MMALLKNYINLIQRKRLPTSWIFFVTSKCNSKCSHCFYWKDLNKIDNELTFNDIQKITLNMGYFDNLLISGGEPTLRNDIADICHLFYVNNKIKSIHFPTNGLNPDNIYDKINLILEKCKGIKLSVGLPLDGLEGTNDYLRGVKGAFRNVVKTAEKLADLKKRFPNLTTYIISVVSNMNYGEMLPLAEYVSKLPVDDHGPSPVRGSPKDYELKPPTSSQWTKLTKDFLASKSLIFKKSENARDIIQRNRRVSMYKYYSKILDKGFIMPCRAGNLVGVIEPNGDMKLCELSGTIGNLKDSGYDIRRIWFSKEAECMREKLKRCFCTHACFLGPSRDSNPFLFLKSLFGN